MTDHSEHNPADSARGSSFLGHVFDSYQNMMQIARCVREAGRQRSVARPRVLELSRRATGLAEYVPETSLVRFATHEDNRPLVTPELVLPYPDRSFDISIVTDAYEHVPAEVRPRFLSEMLRVTHGLVLVGCPNGNEMVGVLDRLVFDFIWGKYASRFEPLEQHVGFGLEPVEDVIASLKMMGADRVAALPCNYVYRWIHQILIYFDLQHLHPSGDLFNAINRIYNERLSPYDYREPCYRYLILVGTDPDLDLEKLAASLRSPPETPAAVAQAEGALVRAFQAVESEASDRLRAWAKELHAIRDENERLRRDNTWAIREIELLRSELARLAPKEEDGAGR